MDKQQWNTFNEWVKGAIRSARGHKKAALKEVKADMLNYGRSGFGRRKLIVHQLTTSLKHARDGEGINAPEISNALNQLDAAAHGHDVYDPAQPKIVTRRSWARSRQYDEAQRNANGLIDYRNYGDEQ